MTTEIFILGAGSFAREVYDMAVHDLGWKVMGFVVDVDSPPELLCLPVLNVDRMAEGHRLFVPGTMGTWRWRLSSKMIMLGHYPQSLVHPSASVSRTAMVQNGALVGRLVAVGADALVSTMAVLNRGATVGHDCTVGWCATVGPGANVAGGATIGAWATVGMGANILENRKIGQKAVVGAGAIVTKDVPDGEVWWGVPARRVR